MITSRANASVRRALALHNKKGRDKNDAFLTEGFILIKEAISAGLEIEQIFFRGDDAVADGMTGMPDKTEMLVLAEGIFDEIAGTVTPQGVMAVVKKPRIASVGNVLNSRPSILVLDRVQDPGNVGTLIRTAFAAGMGAVACVKGTADIYSLKVVRSAAGALFRMPVLQTGSAAETVAALERAGHPIKALHMDDTGKAYSDADLSGRAAIAVGSEGAGLSGEFIAAADEIIYIPMREEAESLNAAVAAGIVMYERYRQCNK